MRESWRWFGPADPVSLEDVRQTGATDIVSALHHIAAGDVWTLDEIRERQVQIENAAAGVVPLRWSVVESIPVHEDIKLGRPGCEVYVDNWIASMENLAQCGIKTICYNFMPVIDWTRTDLKFPLPDGSYALRFDQVAFAAFDLFILERESAAAEYSGAETREARAFFEAMTSEAKQQLVQTVIAGLPGKMTDSYGLEDFRAALENYRGISREQLRQNLCAFLDKVLPRAEQLGVKLAIHPDDPPRDLLGLPRIICTAADLERLFQHCPSPANGITLCVGTYSSRPDNDLPAMARQFAGRIHFAHLRNVRRDPGEPRSFFEASHLDGDTDMVQVIRALLQEEGRRREGGAAAEIFIRPDHGHQMLDDRSKSVNPGYSCIGRLKGLAEIRGVVAALSAG